MHARLRMRRGVVCHLKALLCECATYKKQPRQIDWDIRDGDTGAVGIGHETRTRHKPNTRNTRLMESPNIFTITGTDKLQWQINKFRPEPTYRHLRMNNIW